ncbi:hypothetical protein Trydic_g19220 [Trypoxylus dichotomus]
MSPNPNCNSNKASSDSGTSNEEVLLTVCAAPSPLQGTFPASTHDKMDPQTTTVPRGGIFYRRRNALCTATIDWLRERFRGLTGKIFIRIEPVRGRDNDGTPRQTPPHLPGPRGAPVRHPPSNLPARDQRK